MVMPIVPITHGDDVGDEWLHRPTRDVTTICFSTSTSFSCSVSTPPALLSVVRDQFCPWPFLPR